MPSTRVSRVTYNDDVDDEDGMRRRNPRRCAATKPQSLGESDQDSNEDDADASSSDAESEEEEPAVNRRSRTSTRSSARSNKFTGVMKEQTGNDEDLMETEDDEASSPPRKKSTRATPKSPASCHSSRRRRVKTQVLVSGESDYDESSAEEEEEELQDMKIQRVLASRSEPLRTWKTITEKMNTSEVEHGSRWFQESPPEQEDNFEERFLCKWSDLSYLHCSWETEEDLIDQVDGAKTYLNSFFRKAENGLFYSADERCDGDYFDPAYCQVDRILEIDDQEHRDLIMDKDDPEYEGGTGRQFLIKWGNMPYSLATYEFERDLIINDVEYKEQLEDYFKRTKKPTKAELKAAFRHGDKESRRTYKVFKEGLSEEAEVQEYQKELEEQVFKSGGQLRDYQAVGVSWLLANHVNERSSILADEMGLGKTIQTAVYVQMVASKLQRRGPFLIVAPLSTLPHWYREFTGWTDLNTIVYHGSASDREFIREFEFAYEGDRPQGGNVGFNQSYLKKCLPKKPKRGKAKDKMLWMAQVVITTPEMLVTDDFSELTAVHWDVLVVDEAHRLKNHNSKLANNLRDDRFQFDQTLLLTGTPIQNNMTELWTLLNIIDAVNFDSIDGFLSEYGDIKSKEKVDELHERIRPYILRRLKEDVEKSVPPKEETLIEVELTVLQKQYYRALYEKNVQFLHRNKKKALDGPSISNLAMQLRKCCNHPFLLNGVEEEVRASQEKMSEGDFLSKASGKLVLLDKLLPLLKKDGHRVLLFSQFKIMLDILEDYLAARTMKFERIDGSITGSKRQMAIDRFQSECTNKDDEPFIMLLSTRAGGVGINLTAADTCIIFDSDWNPQNDLQAQARCHRIGQTKNVQVYRLLCRKTYEMQMFHMSSLKMGLDQAVLQGFESGASSNDPGTMTKEEVERLLRHGAYDMFNEEKAGSSEAESNEFVQQDIETILARRSRTVVHENTGSKSKAAGGTFSKASFKAVKSPDKQGGGHDDIDIDDPEFWKKMVGEGNMGKNEADLTGMKRSRKQANYSERDYERRMNARLIDSDSDDDSSSTSSGSESDISAAWSKDTNPQGDEPLAVDEGATSAADGEAGAAAETAVLRRRIRKKKKKPERSKWGGGGINDWEKADVEKLARALQLYGYGNLEWERFAKKIDFPKRSDYSVDQIKRMSWSLALLALREAADEDVAGARRRAERAAEKRRESEGKSISPSARDGGVLATATVESDVIKRREEDRAQLSVSFGKLWSANSPWASLAVNDALAFAECNAPRAKEILNEALKETSIGEASSQSDGALAQFGRNIWPSLKSRGWTSSIEVDGKHAGSTHYHYQGKQYRSPEAVLRAVPSIHPELSIAVQTVLAAIAAAEEEKERSRLMEAKNASLEPSKVTPASLSLFMQMYAPLPLIADRKRYRKISVPRRILGVCSMLHTAKTVVEQCSVSSDVSTVDEIARRLCVHRRLAMPHPAWTPRHDAVLISAIAKHGWIDHDACCRAIVEDSTIKWGAPFDEERAEGGKSSVPPLSQKEVQSEKENIVMLKETAKRAAKFFTAENDLIFGTEIKGFKPSLLVKAYGLESKEVVVHERKDGHERQVEGESCDGKEKEPVEWIVNENLLDGFSSSSDDGYVNDDNVDDDEPRSNEPVDLPNKKDLLRRAKSVLSTPLDALLKQAQSAPSDSHGASTPTSKHKYLTLDQSDRCNILLAEMIRSLMKAPMAKNAKMLNACRNLCVHAIHEANSRSEDLKSNEEKRVEAGESASLSPSGEMEKISLQLVEVKRNMKGSARQAKNVLRVMLGLNPIPGKNAADDLFPSEATLTDTSADDGDGVGNKSGHSSKEKGDHATGDRAVSRAMRRATTADGSAKFFSCPGDTSDLQLTATETLLLSVISSQGLPIWTPHWNDLIDTSDVDPDLQGPGSEYAISWHGMGYVAEAAADVWHSVALKKLKVEKKQYEKKFATDHSKSTPEGMRALRKVEAAELAERLKRRTAQIAIDYKNDPLKLAKKCIMLLEALRQRMGPITIKRGGAAQKAKSENYLGPKVLRWLGKELVRWATSLSILDATGKPLANTAAEFIVDIPRYLEDDAYSVAAIFDKKLCRDVFSQVAQQSRTRSVFLKNTTDEIKELVEVAMQNSYNAGDDWDGPSWWGGGASVSPIQHDCELLSGLLEFGFSGFDEFVDTFHAIPEGSNEDKLVRSSAQKRANQLTRELNALDETSNMMKIVRDKRNGGGNMKPSSPTGLGIHSFFGSNREPSDEEASVIVLSDSEASTPKASSPGISSKRKDNVVDIDAELSSAEKKQRTT